MGNCHLSLCHKWEYMSVFFSRSMNRNTVSKTLPLISLLFLSITQDVKDQTTNQGLAGSCCGFLPLYHQRSFLLSFIYGFLILKHFLS